MNKNPGVRLAKRIILGKNKPTPLLRYLCWFTIVWSTICAVFFIGTGVYEFITLNDIQIESTNNYTSKFSFIYGLLHVVSIFSAILIYRLKKIGFYLYSLSNIAMVVFPIFYLNVKVNYFLVGVTLLLIGLFATQMKKLS